MQNFFRHTTPFVLIFAIVVSHLQFVVYLEYCTEFIQFEDGSMCTTAMMQGNIPESDQGVHVLTPSNSCCASVSIETDNQLFALVKDTKPLQKSSFIRAIVQPTQTQSIPGLTIYCSTPRQIHFPSISQLLVESSILLI